jgi:hypothetical protein
MRSIIIPHRLPRLRATTRPLPAITRRRLIIPGTAAHRGTQYKAETVRRIAGRVEASITAAVDIMAEVGITAEAMAVRVATRCRMAFANRTGATSGIA